MLLVIPVKKKFKQRKMSCHISWSLPRSRVALPDRVNLRMRRGCGLQQDELTDTVHWAMATYPPPSIPGGPSMRVELHLSCKKLRDADVFSKSDPLVVVYTHNKSNDKWNEVGAARQIITFTSVLLSQVFSVLIRKSLNTELCLPKLRCIKLDKSSVMRNSNIYAHMQTKKGCWWICYENCHV